MKDILGQVNHKDGMVTPENYFQDFATRMFSQLPEQPWEREEPKVIPRSFWQKVRPYVYLAAMFMGVWCMMKMFDLMRPDSPGLSIDNNPIMTAALGNDVFIDDYFLDEGDVTDNQLLDDLYEAGYDPDSYEDFIGTESSFDSLSPEPSFPMSENQMSE